jgi:flagellar hook assembly protein FlgD
MPWLITAYPNPSSNNTSIVFGINEKGVVELSLLNMNGQVVKSIFKGDLDKGTHQVTLDCMNLPKGIYIARLQSNNGITSQKLVVR